ncbi:MAG: allantoicase, partial [Gemmatimonadetes bacterium]|nr:allantoicase [Gemmatimonadota bacterium]NIR34494.1 allantoicase [Actinomycetota bacterium]NIU63930.1 allantoicase [Actinomycetota bacterium]NIW25727.1 allantoicase [Actinomycetota bacterium]NIX18337.1 allantoicase [Actinomycetota bacterium]
PADHHDGWVTRRRRAPGNEWAVIRLGGRSLLERIEVDTRKFPGDSPAEAVVMAIDTAGNPMPDDPRWRPLVERFE